MLCAFALLCKWKTSSAIPYESGLTAATASCTATPAITPATAVFADWAIARFAANFLASLSLLLILPLNVSVAFSIAFASASALSAPPILRKATLACARAKSMSERSFSITSKLPLENRIKSTFRSSLIFTAASIAANAFIKPSLSPDETAELTSLVKSVAESIS